MGEEQVMVRPELTLLARAAGRFSRGLSLWVDLAQREVSIRQAHTAFIFGKQVLQGRLNLPAEGTLEIGELNNYDRGLGASLQPGAVIGDLDPGRSQQDGHSGLLPEVFQILLPSLLDF